MRHREISLEQAREVRVILSEECGYRVDPRYDHLAETISTETGRKHVCYEYRFIGDLGFGGKFRNNGNNNNTPHVDCYREHETPDRLAMIERANARLTALFNP